MQGEEKEGLARLGLGLGLASMGLWLGVEPLSALGTLGVGLVSNVGGDLVSGVSEERFAAWAERWDESVLNHDIEQALALALSRAAKDVREEVEKEFRDFGRWGRSQRRWANEQIRRLRYFEEQSEEALGAWLHDEARREEVLGLIQGDKGVLSEALVARVEEDFPDQAHFFSFRLPQLLAHRWRDHFWEVLKEDTKAWRACEPLWRGRLVEILLSLSQQNEREFERLKAKFETLPPPLSLSAVEGLLRQLWQEILARPFAQLQGDLRDIYRQGERLLVGQSETHRKLDQLLAAHSSSLEEAPAFLNTARLPPPAFAARPDEFEQLLVSLLGEEGGGASRSLTALVGGGGFGKTTLAQAVCDDERVKATFEDGILWVTLGEMPNVVQLLSNQIKLLAPREHVSNDEEAAAARLRDLCRGKRLLLVLDDVWRESDVRAFLSDSPTCAYLLTTRRQDLILRLAANAVDVKEMKRDEATQLLAFGLPDSTDRRALEALGAYLGKWPLLLKLAASQLQALMRHEGLLLEEAITELREALEEEGFTVFDDEDEEGRDYAIRISLEISLKRLGKWRPRFLELALFAPHVDIPAVVIGRLWKETATLSRYQTKKALRAMRNLSLFTNYEPQAQTVRLHDVIRELLASFWEDLPGLHGRFLDAYEGAWAEFPMNEPYLWHHLAYHLHEAECDDELLALLCSFDWLQGKLRVTDVNALLGDYEWLGEDEVVGRVGEVLRNAAHILGDDRAYLAGQLLARLMADEREAIQGLVREARDALRAPCLVPLRASLEAREAFQRTFEDHISAIHGVAIGEGVVVSGSSDKTLKVWDVGRGEELLSLRGHAHRVTAVVCYQGWAISGARDGVINVWDLMRGELLRTWCGHSEEITALAIYERYLLSASEDKTVKVWDVEHGELLRTLAHDEVVTGVAAALGRVISADDSGKLMVWEMGSGEQLASWQGHDEEVTGLAVWDQWMVSGSHDMCLKVWDVAEGREVALLRGHRDWVTGVAMGEEIVVSVSEDKVLRVWQWRKSGDCYASFDLDEPLYACAIDGATQTIVAGGASGRLHLLRLEDE